MIQKMSEARLNDLVYMILKKSFFEPAMQANPRECDIRVCMDMTCNERITSVMSAILLPNEKSGKSHDVTYDVDTDKCFEECLDYLEDHWMKQTVDEACGKDGTRAEMKKWYEENIVPGVLAVKEAECGG